MAIEQLRRPRRASPYVSMLSTDAPRKEYYCDHESQNKGVIKYVQLRLQCRDRGGQRRHIMRSRRSGAYTKLQIQSGVQNEELRAPDLNWRQDLSSDSIYGIACDFDALADLEELQIRKSSDWPNDRVRIRFELQIGSVLNPSDSIWSCNRTTP
jgi:hypothetical protein